MILRTPLVTEESCLLRAPPEVRSGQAAAPAAMWADDGPALVDSSVSVTPEPAPKEPLTFESVGAWLAVQDSETREACAAILAEELEMVFEKAHAEGYRQGTEAARRKAEEALESSTKVLERLAIAAEEKFAAESAALAESCADIVAEALTKIAGPMLETKAAAIGAVEQVLQRVKEARELVIRVHSEDVETIRAAESRLETALAGRKLQVAADGRIAIGGCIVESSLGGLDGRFEVQLRELFDLLRAAKGAGDRP